MDPERPHRSTSINNSSTSGNNTTSELFICFTSRLSSSSSMKISSKSILSPGRSRESSSHISLSSSLSRRLRNNGSMKGGQASPMFPTNSGKKRGSGFDNPEPSSPKVTCIGQVRVKTKKQGKKFRACRSKRRGEVSFRKVDHNNGGNSLDSSSSQDYNMGHFLSSNSSHHQQQQECKKWVHLPLTICEALRAFGAEFNCFLPCRSSCMANQRDKEGKTRGSSANVGNGNKNGNGRSSCGAVFTRWLVAVQEGEGKEREIELVVGGGEDDERRESSEMMMMRREVEEHELVQEDTLEVEREEREVKFEQEMEHQLSMEVSKETWVCSTDFIRWLPEKRKQQVVKPKDSGDEPKRRISVDSNPLPIFLQPPRSSCSFPAAPPMDTAGAEAVNGAGSGGSKTTMMEHKLVGGKGYEPFPLTRCKSEPRRSSAKLAPDACFWKNRKLEPTSVGVGGVLMSRVG
ncbi:hypothetical protein GOBAR_DD20008 [Gossypium barbadense]|nr:hypothetical protein GOBAR_DD20008 [Gossypium barbadense]